MTDIVIQVLPETDRLEAAQALENLTGLQVEPLFSDTGDAHLRPWLHLALPHDRDADQVVRELADHPVVESAYVKPPESTP